jgi:hypothetical protein
MADSFAPLPLGDRPAQSLQEIENTGKTQVGGVGRVRFVTVTKRSCLWCGRTFTVSGGPGRPRLYCKPSCKQRDYEARRRSEELGLGEHELVVTREELDAIRDRQFLLACTVEDVQRDLANGDVDERDAFGVLLEAAREFVA